MNDVCVCGHWNNENKLVYTAGVVMRGCVSSCSGKTQYGVLCVVRQGEDRIRHNWLWKHMNFGAVTEFRPAGGCTAALTFL